MSSASGIGGVETWLSKVARELPGRGYEPIVALTRGLSTNDPGQYQVLQDNLTHVEVNGAGLPRSSRIFACLRVIRRVQPRIVLPLGVIDAVPACGLAKQSNDQTRVICRTQGLLPPMLADLEDFESTFDFAVCDGRLNAQYLESIIGFPGHRIRHIPNGADLPLRARRVRSPGEPIHLVYVGRLTQGDKRAMDLIPLVQYLAELGLAHRLTVVGDGASGAHIRRALGSFDQVSFTGSIQHERVYQEVFPSADVLLSFSASESFGISIVEAMMHGVVPVSSRFLGHRTVGTVEDGVNALLFDIGDTRHAARHIQTLADDPALLERLAASAKAKAQAEFGWNRCIDGWIEVLDEVRDLPQRTVSIDFKRALRGNAGKLDQLPLSPRLVDWLRRIRARLSPAVGSGGEEWPLHLRHHDAARLEHIARRCQEIEDALADAFPENRSDTDGSFKTGASAR